MILRIRDLVEIMSTKLVKRGLDFVSSTQESIQKRHKKTQKKKTRKSIKRELDVLHQGSLSSKKGKTKTTVDYTKQNLKYFERSAWSIHKDTYDKIVQHQEKHSKKGEKPSTDDKEEEDDSF